MAKLFANSGDPDKMLRSASSDQVCTACKIPFGELQAKIDLYGLPVSRLKCANSSPLTSETSKRSILLPFAIY